MEHEHEVRHLSEYDRRKFLHIGGLATGLAFINSIVSLETATALPTAKLPGFTAFAKTVKVFKSDKYYLVESNGIPAHQMMVGIKSWQQQVPTVQNYAGSNAWSIPIKPVIATNPMSAKDHFLRGAIAIAVNGVPIFNALNNRGDDALLAGELDDWGGHCGRADDYHYHIAPTHLQTVKNSPYINGGFKGVVTEIEGQVDPQALTKAFRPAGAPLKGAAITGLERVGDTSFDLKYTMNAVDYHVKYTATLAEVNMQFIDPQGAIRTEVYQRK